MAGSGSGLPNQNIIFSRPPSFNQSSCKTGNLHTVSRKTVHKKVHLPVLRDKLNHMADITVVSVFNYNKISCLCIYALAESYSQDSETKRLRNFQNILGV